MASVHGKTADGFKQLVDKLAKKAARSNKDDNVSVVVGFTANYALYVHERVEMKWKGLPRGQGFYVDDDGVIRFPSRVRETGRVGGKHRGFYWDPQGRAQAKFLEAPARELKDEFGRIVGEAAAKGATLATALLTAGYRLQREAMLRCPVDTGNLKASAFTRLESGKETTVQ